MKTVKDILDRLNAISSSNNGNGNGNGNRDPPRFYIYRQARAEKREASDKKSDYDNSVTQDELDYSLKRKLRVTPEARYQREKRN